MFLKCLLSYLTKVSGLLFCLVLPAAPVETLFRHTLPVVVEHILYILSAAELIFCLLLEVAGLTVYLALPAVAGLLFCYSQQNCN